MKIPKIIFNHIEGGGEVNILPVMNIEGSSNLEEIDLPQTLPILALRNAVIFPGTVLPITVSRDKSLKLIKAIYKSTKIIGTVTQIDIKVEDPENYSHTTVGHLNYFENFCRCSSVVQIVFLRILYFYIY